MNWRNISNFTKLRRQLICLLFFSIFIQLCTGNPTFAQDINIIPIDTTGSVGLNCILHVDNEDNPHILYYDYTNSETKHAKFQNGIWSLNNTGISNQIDGFTIDSLNNLHCSKANYSTLLYSFISDDTIYTEIVDSTDGRFSASDIALQAESPKIVCVQYFEPVSLIEYDRLETGWEGDVISPLPQYPSNVYLSIVNDINYATCIGTDESILLYFKWTSSYVTVDTVLEDSLYTVRGIDVSNDNTPWILFNRGFQNNYNLVLTTKTGENWSFETIDSLSGSVGYFHLKYSNINEQPFVIFITSGLPPRNLVIGYRTENGWAFEEVFYGDLRGCSIDIDSNGNIHFCFNIYEDGNYQLYYGLWSRITDIEYEFAQLPEFQSMAYPNPFNAQTTIHYSMAKLSDVTIEIYDLLGRKVETLIDAEAQAGQHQIVWNASKYSSGLYFYRIKAENYIETKKMVLLK